MLVLRLTARVLTRLLDLTPAWLLRAAHDLGLAAWFGGAYMGAVALNGASREVEDPTQRSRVANAGWFRWAAILPSAIGLHLLGAVGLSRRTGEVPPHRLAAVLPGGERLRRAPDRGGAGAALRGAALTSALAATAVSGAAGRRAAAAGDVPVATAVQPISDTPAEVARALRLLRVVQWVIPAATAAVVVVDAWQQHHGGTRLPLRHR